jgi:ribose/xylose/arabinose/galactoside ABC-type transport system permease subunit
MVAVVNSVVVGACVGLAVEVLPIRSFVIALAAGATAGAATLSSHRRHHRRATYAYTPQDIDRAAIFLSPGQ